jgi:hypothetical protein
VDSRTPQSRRLARPAAHLDRRTFLVGLGAATLITACGGGDDTVHLRQGDQDTTTAKDSAPVLGTGFANGYSANSIYVAGSPQRLPFVLFAGPGKVLRDKAPATVDISVTDVATKTVVFTETLRQHSDGIPTPYYPLTHTFATPGDFEASITGSSVPAPFKIVEPSKTNIIQLGAAMRSVDTPTVSDPKGVKPICTRGEQCPLHTVSFKDVLANPTGPMVLMISTPGFCQTAICGPVLELLLAEHSARPQFTMVHAEVYIDPLNDTSKERKTTPAVQTYALEYEPSLIVANAKGIVTARLDYTWDAPELKAALDSAVA